MKMRPVIAGHRGAAGIAPENTLESFRAAVELGVRVLELDVRLTHDGFVVVFHDDRLDRITPERGRVDARDWESLAGVTVMPGAFGGRYPQARIPMLTAVLLAMPSDCRFLVELKPEPERGDELVRRTLAELRDADALGRGRLISFEQELLQTARRSDDSVALGVLVNPRDRGSLLARAQEVQAEALHPQHSLVDADLMREAQTEGFRVNAWTVNSPQDAQRLAGLGVHELTTDYPDRLFVE